MSRLVLVGLMLLACARVVSTYWTFNHTIDEPTHIACGLELLQEGRYTYEYQHPPLARVMAAMGPWLLGVRNVASKAELPSKNPMVLYGSASYERTLAWARAGELPFLVLGALATFWWGRRLAGERVGLWAAGLLLLLPPVLAHAGLATTDVSVMALLPLALLALDCWLDGPSLLGSLALGVAIGLGVLAKFSFLLFFPVCALPLLIGRFRGWRWIWLVGLGALVVVCAGYGFTRDFRELYLGLLEVRDHNHDGHRTFLLGEVNTTGWWYFFPVVLFYKTPLSFLALALVGGFVALRGRLRAGVPLLCALCLLAVVLPARINLGVRHILPIYPLLAIGAGLGVEQLRPRFVALALVGWLVLASGLAHPDYLAYFNEAAMGEPEEIRVDSDLDWGQNVARLARRLRERGITEPVGLGLFSSADLSNHGLVWYPASPWKPSAGWVAVSATEMMLGEPGAWAWLGRYKPVEKVGGAVWLYHIDLPPQR